jgi:hypothetical protein
MDKVGYFQIRFSFKVVLEILYVHFSLWQQTNTADMLDLAVVYIKDLQKQYKVWRRKTKNQGIISKYIIRHSRIYVPLQTLSDNRANCKCLSKQKPVQNRIVWGASVQKSKGLFDQFLLIFSISKQR